MKRTIGSWTVSLQNYLATAQRLSLAILCGLLLAGSSLAQEPRSEQQPMPDEPTPEASTMHKPRTRTRR